MNKPTHLTLRQTQLISELVPLVTKALRIDAAKHRTDPALRPVFKYYDAIVGEASEIRIHQVTDLLNVYVQFLGPAPYDEHKQLAFEACSEIYNIALGRKHVEEREEFAEARGKVIALSERLDFLNLSPRAKKDRLERAGLKSNIEKADADTPKTPASPETQVPPMPDDLKGTFRTAVKAFGEIIELKSKSFNTVRSPYQNYANLLRGLPLRPITIERLVADLHVIHGASGAAEERKALALEYLQLAEQISSGTCTQADTATTMLEELDKKCAGMNWSMDKKKPAAGSTSRKSKYAAIDAINASPLQRKPTDYINAALNLYGGMTGLKLGDFIMDSPHGSMPVKYVEFIDAAEHMNTIPNDQLLPLLDALEARVPDLKLDELQRGLAQRVLHFIRDTAAGNDIESCGERLKELITQAQELKLTTWTFGVSNTGRAGWVKDLTRGANIR